MMPDPDPLDGTVPHVHDWTPSEYPAVMYPGVADWSGTMRCRTCRTGFRWWSSEETAEYWSDLGIPRAGRSLRRFTLRFVFVLGVVTGLLLGAAVARL